MTMVKIAHCYLPENTEEAFHFNMLQIILPLPTSAALQKQS